MKPLKATTFIKRHGKLLEIYEETGSVWLPQKAYFGLELRVRGELFGESHSWRLDNEIDPEHVQHVKKRVAKTSRDSRNRADVPGIYVYNQRHIGDVAWHDERFPGVKYVENTT